MVGQYWLDKMSIIEDKYNTIDAFGDAEGLTGLNKVDNFSIPKCGIEDIDYAIFKLFDKDLNIVYKTKNNIKKVPVVFAAGERYSLFVNKKRPLRDASGALILPIISIERKNINFSDKTYDMGTNTINSHVIKKRLTAEDQEYQKLINKNNYKNSDSLTDDQNFLSSNQTGVFPGKIATRRNKTKENNNFLESKINKNIYEVIVMPAPKYVTVQYTATIWTDYIVSMNEILSNIIIKSKYKVPAYLISTKSGYWFNAFFSENINSENNFEDFSDNLRIIKSSIEISVPSYLIGKNSMSEENNLRKYISSPDISFEFNVGNIYSPAQKNNNQEFLSDILTEDDLKKQTETSVGGSTTDTEQKIIKHEKDIFTGENKSKEYYVKTRTNRFGETVLKEIL